MDIPLDLPRLAPLWNGHLLIAGYLNFLIHPRHRLSEGDFIIVIELSFHVDLGARSLVMLTYQIFSSLWPRCHTNFLLIQNGHNFLLILFSLQVKIKNFVFIIE